MDVNKEDKVKHRGFLDYGHSIEAWTDKSALAAETFAQMAAAKVTNPEAYKMTEAYLRLEELFIQLLKEMIK